MSGATWSVHIFAALKSNVLYIYVCSTFDCKPLSRSHNQALIALVSVNNITIPTINNVLISSRRIFIIFCVFSYNYVSLRLYPLQQLKRFKILTFLFVDIIIINGLMSIHQRSLSKGITSNSLRSKYSYLNLLGINPL